MCCLLERGIKKYHYGVVKLNMTKTIDIHGMTCAEAEREVLLQIYSIEESDSFVEELIIIFGKGTGTLRQCVTEAVEQEGYSYT
jgi:DNA-nicking Smr family endonuclease